MTRNNPPRNWIRDWQMVEDKKRQLRVSEKIALLRRQRRNPSDRPELIVAIIEREMRRLSK